MARNNSQEKPQQTKKKKSKPESDLKLLQEQSAEITKDITQRALEELAKHGSILSH